MTREEKINTIKAVIQECEEYQWQRRETLFEIIKDLEQEPCEDCVSRQAVNELFDSEIKMYKERIETRKGSNYHDETERIKEFRSRIANAEYWQNKIKALPPVTPQQEPCEDAISRADAVKVASGYCHPSNIAKELAKLPPVTSKQRWIPANATNGDMIKAMFPNASVSEKFPIGKYDEVYNVLIEFADGVTNEMRVMKNWWNAPYKGENGNKE